MAEPEPGPRQPLRRQRPRVLSRETVAIVLAVGLVTALNLVTIAAVFDAITNEGGLSENATQILTGAFGGILGVLGSFIGYRAGADAAIRRIDDPAATEVVDEDG
jgi:hypothetical protein